MNLLHQAKAVAIILLLIWMTGCQSYLARRIAQTPNHAKTLSDLDTPLDETLKSLGIDQQLRVEVGPPSASLSVWIVEPKPYEQVVTFDSKKVWTTIKLKTFTKPNPLAATNPKATVICLHGLENQKQTVFMLWGALLASKGYRVIVVDLRGHGRSTGDWLTYGVVESVDISQLIDALEQQGLIAGKLGMLGMSYGATVAIKTAAIDRRIDAVVAIAPFSSLAQTTPDILLAIQKRNWLARFISVETAQRAVQEAGELAHFDPAQADAVEAIRQVQVPVLLLHGSGDGLVPLRHSREIYRAATGRSRLVVLEDRNHILSVFPFKQAHNEVLAWFNTWLDDPAARPTPK